MTATLTNANETLAAQKRIGTAASSLVIDQPFFASLLLSMPRRASYAFPTFATDGRGIYFNPSFALSLTIDEIKAVLCHEVLHVTLAHHVRRGSRDRERWNIAADYAINPIVRDAGMTLPKGALFSKDFEGMSAEAIYSRLPESRNKQGGGKSCGEVLDLPEGVPTGEMPGEGEEGRARYVDSGEASAEQSEILISAQCAAIAAKRAGKLPAGLEHLLAELRAPQVDWKTALADFMTGAAKDNEDWRRPSRRSPTMGTRRVCLPSRYSEGIGHGLIALDTSGSVSDAELSQFLGEVNAIAERVGFEKLTVLQIDAEIADVKEYGPHDLPLPAQGFRIKGRGGTTFSPAWKWLRESGEQVDFIVYMTDGYGEFPNEIAAQTGVPTLWLITSDVTATFGRTVHVKVG